MNYRTILKSQLERRQELNPRYSLRSFAKRLAISASKLSEVMSGKKKLSPARAVEIAQNLGLSGKDKEIFVLTAELESRKRKERLEIQGRVDELVQQINAHKTEQRNAWYFGATKALKEKGRTSSEIQSKTGLTALQVENAERFLNRIKRFHPEREELSYEPNSLLNKINDSAATESLQLEADFVFLTKAQAEELQLKIKTLVKSYKMKNSNETDELQLFCWGHLEI